MCLILLEQIQAYNFNMSIYSYQAIVNTQSSLVYIPQSFGLDCGAGIFYAHIHFFGIWSGSILLFLCLCWNLHFPSILYAFSSQILMKTSMNFRQGIFLDSISVHIAIYIHVYGCHNYWLNNKRMSAYTCYYIAVLFVFW